MVLAKSSRVIKVIIIALIVSISQSLVLVQAINHPAAESNIQAISSSSKFASEINPGRYYTNPDTKKGYYLIGSTNQGFEHTTPEGPTPIVDNKTVIQPTSNVNTTTPEGPTPIVDNKTVIQPTSNVSTTTPVSRIEPTQSVININKDISKAYNVLLVTINSKIKQPQSKPKPIKKTRKDDGGSGIYVPASPNGSPGSKPNSGEPTPKIDTSTAISDTIGRFN